MAAAGAPVKDLLVYLRERCGPHEHRPYQYLSEAFLQGDQFFFMIGPGVAHFHELDEREERRARRLIDEHRAAWQAQRYPALRRVRDYISFLEFARDEQVIVTVCDPAPGSDEYRLHGAYDVDSRQPVWSARRGEKLRASINRRLGGELVRGGPHDDWEHRNDRSIAGPLWGPQTPAITFWPDGYVRNHVSLADLARSEPYDEHWDRLYPHHPIPDEDDEE
jgi:hypothetical protein